MKRLFTLLLALGSLGSAAACTNFIITRGASADSSTMVTYSADSHQLYGALYKYNAPRHKYADGTMLKIYEWDTGKYLGEIPQARQTYSTVGNMNEHQLIIAETTFGGREELVNVDGIMDYGSLIYVTLQRARTAREAINTIVELANAYGYPSEGESFSIADSDEAWIMELVGKGSERGIVWVARRIPDGTVSAHANQARITQFPMNDPENCMYAPDVVEFARAKGYYTGSDADFSFADAYCPLDFGGMRACEARVWSFMRHVADGMDAYTDYAMGYNASNRMPLWVTPTHRLSLKEVMNLMRDHYEGTPMDMTRDSDAGTAGTGLPYRWRPMNFEVDGVEYLNERATSTQQTGFWFVAQARNYLPDEIGGVLWFGVDDTATSALTPIYCSVSRVPKCFSESEGSMMHYSDDSAFWLFNRVANFAYLRYNRIAADIRSSADEWEQQCIDEQQQVEHKALKRYKYCKKWARIYLTRYSVRTADKLFERWQALDEYLLVKYIDGNIKVEDENGFKDNGNGRGIPTSPIFEGYGECWKRAVAASDDGTLRVPQK